MNFTDYWRRLAEDQLRPLWQNPAIREAVADAADDANRVPRDSAHELGESRDRSTWRVWFQRPLCVAYQIDETAAVVYVVAVKWVGV